MSDQAWKRTLYIIGSVMMIFLFGITILHDQGFNVYNSNVFNTFMIVGVLVGGYLLVLILFRLRRKKFDLQTFLQSFLVFVCLGLFWFIVNISK